MLLPHRHLLDFDNGLIAIPYSKRDIWDTHLRSIRHSDRWMESMKRRTWLAKCIFINQNRQGHGLE